MQDFTDVGRDTEIDLLNQPLKCQHVTTARLSGSTGLRALEEWGRRDGHSPVELTIPTTG